MKNIDIRKLDCFKNRCLRKYQTGKCSAQENNILIKPDSSIDFTIKMWKLSWLGLVLRMSGEDLPNATLEFLKQTTAKVRQGGPEKRVGR